MLNCKKRPKRLDESRLLPCGKTVCSECVLSIQVKEKEFQCLICQDKHEMPKNGLPVNE